MKSITILIDSREKNPWDFSIYGFKQRVECLSTGDYTIEGLQHSFVIEKKFSPSEMAINLGRNLKQFEAEFERMKDISHKYLICEFSSKQLAQFPAYSSVPKKMRKRVRIRGPYMIKKIEELCNKYEVELIFCDDRAGAEKQAYSIIKELVNG